MFCADLHGFCSGKMLADSRKDISDDTNEKSVPLRGLSRANLWQDYVEMGYFPIGSDSLWWWNTQPSCW